MTGRYERSPQGLHRDNTSIFLCQVEGSKTMHIESREMLGEIAKVQIE